MAQQPQRLDGINPLAYLGTNPYTPPGMYGYQRDPTPNDYQGFLIGDFWINRTSLVLWYLANKSMGGLPVSQWIPLGSGAGSGLLTLTGNTGGAITGDALRNIDVIGANPYTVTGDLASHSLTISDNGAVMYGVLLDDNNVVTPITNILQLSGHINLATYEVGAHNAGIKLVNFTDHALTVGNASGALSSLGVATNGQLPIGSVGADPVLATLSQGRDITITNGAGSISIDVNNAITLGDLSPLAPGTPSLTLTTGDLNMLGSNLSLTTYQTLRIGGAMLNFLYNNIMFGFSVGNTLVTPGVGIFNIAMGTFCYNALTTGAENLAIGQGVHQSLTTGTANVGLGYTTQNAVTTGNRNISIGPRALGDGSGGNGLKTGVGNIAIGNQAGLNYNGAESYNILIGDSLFSTVGESNTLRIGTGTGTATGELNRAFVSGIRGITTGNADAVAVLIDSAGQLGTVSSSIRYKDNVRDMDEDSNLIYCLRPVTFNYKKFPDSKEYGLIAEEVAEVLPELVVYKDGEPETVKYHILCNLLLNEIQKLEKRVTELEGR